MALMTFYIFCFNKYKPEAELKKVFETSEDVMKKFYAQVDLVYLSGELTIPVCKESEEILKNVKFTSVDDILQVYRK
jgi:hypothetical protein